MSTPTEPLDLNGEDLSDKEIRMEAMFMAYYNVSMETNVVDNKAAIQIIESFAASKDSGFNDDDVSALKAATKNPHTLSGVAKEVAKKEISEFQQRLVEAQKDSINTVLADRRKEQEFFLSGTDADYKKRFTDGITAIKEKAFAEIDPNADNAIEQLSTFLTAQANINFSRSCKMIKTPHLGVAPSVPQQ